MLEKLEKEIELDKEIIASFPTNNKKNQEKYLSEMQKRINSYKQLENDVYIELCERIKPYLNLETSKLNDINDGILELSKALAFTNNLNTAYEKLGLDKIVCKISNYSKENLNEINKIILDAIKAFEYAGIILKSKDFNYTKFVNKYMTAFFDNIDNLDSEKLKNIFNDIYWKNPDTILEIELNIRYLYLINKAKIEKNILKIQKEILNSFNKGEEKMIENYSYLRNRLETEKEKDKNALINKFTSGELKIDSYTDDKISKITNELFPININYEIVKDLLNSLQEYKKHLSYEEIITKVKTLFNETLEKNFLDNKLKTIIKLEKKREKLNSKKMGVIKKTHVDKNELEINKLVKEIKINYDEIDNNIFKCVVKKHIEENSTYFKVLLLACQYYKILFDEFNEKGNCDLEAEKLYSYVLNPNNNIINNITLLEEVDVADIIVEKYRLSNVNLTKDMISEGNLDSTIADLEKVIINYQLKKYEVPQIDLQNFEKIKQIQEKRQNTM